MQSQKNNKNVILSDRRESKNLRIYSLVKQQTGAKILRFASLTQDDRKITL